jgi:hypothetical protein
MYGLSPGLPKFWSCHRSWSKLTKWKSWQACHGHGWVTNQLRLYSTSTMLLPSIHGLHVHAKSFAWPFHFYSSNISAWSSDIVWRYEDWFCERCDAFLASWRIKIKSLHLFPWQLHTCSHLYTTICGFSICSNLTYHGFPPEILYSSIS